MSFADTPPATVNGEAHEVVNGLDGLDTELVLKHPLLNTWTLWYFKMEKTREWSENQRQVLSFSTAEDFWA